MYKIKQKHIKFIWWLNMYFMIFFIKGCAEKKVKNTNIQQTHLENINPNSDSLAINQEVAIGAFPFPTQKIEGFHTLKSKIEIEGMVIINKNKKDKIDYRIYIPEFSYYGACKWEDIPKELVDENYNKINLEKERLWVVLKCDLKRYKNHFAPNDFFTTGVYIFNSKDIQFLKKEYQAIKEWRKEYLEFKNNRK